jgi:hypothetical protein
MSQVLSSSLKEHINVNWYNDRVLDIIKEIKDSNGKISNVINGENLVKVMSRISNYIRYDIISKNEVITYKVSDETQNDIMNLFS